MGQPARRRGCLACVLLLFSILPFFSTLLGGLAALRLRHRLHPIMAFASGVLVATALADILPEAADLVGGDRPPVEAATLVGAAAVVGFLLFSALEALVHRDTWEHQHAPTQDVHTPHQHAGEARSGAEVDGTAAGLLGPLGLITHSTLDGLAIGLGFRISPELGLVVGLAVLVHDFADGLNVVTLATAGGRGRTAVLVLLGLDALAPVVGAGLSQVVTVSSGTLGLLIASFAGVFVAIGAGHLLPEAQHGRPGAAPALVLLAAAGAAVVLAVRSLAG